MEALEAEMWQDAQGQPEDSFSPFVAATELDEVTEEIQEKKEEKPSGTGTPLQPEDVPGVESKATDLEDENKSTKGTFQDPSASSGHAQRKMRQALKEENAEEKGTRPKCKAKAKAGKAKAKSKSKLEREAEIEDPEIQAEENQVMEELKTEDAEPKTPTATGRGRGRRGKGRGRGKREAQDKLQHDNAKVAKRGENEDAGSKEVKEQEKVSEEEETRRLAEQKRLTAMGDANYQAEAPRWRATVEAESKAMGLLDPPASSGQKPEKPAGPEEAVDPTVDKRKDVEKSPEAKKKPKQDRGTNMACRPLTWHVDP
eukprot:s2630_g4.t1